MDTFEKVNSVHHSDIYDQDDLCNVKSTILDVSFVEILDFSKQNMLLNHTPHTSLFLSDLHMNIFEKINSANDTDILDKDNLRNFTNTIAAFSFMEYLDYSKKNMLSICPPQKILLSSYCHMNTLEY